MPKPFFSARHFEASVNPPTRLTAPPSTWPQEWKTIHFKVYPRLPRWPLTPSETLRKPVDQLLSYRRSRRDFRSRSITFRELSDLLVWAAGLQKQTDGQRTVFHRTYASGGARFPLEIYPLVLRCSIPRGVYHYNVWENSLELLLERDLLPELDEYLIDPIQWRKCAVALLITAVFPRNQVKYGERGYRYVFIEAGHLGQNVYLVSEALGLKCCAVGGFVDQAVNRLLDIDGVNEAPIYSLLVGK